MVYKRVLKMSDDSELYRTLQKAILNLRDVKPEYPIRFLADYFSFECEDDPFAAAINLFDSLTIFHPVTEERIAKCYDILSSCGEFQGTLVGAHYHKFIRQLVMRLHVSSELRKTIIDYLYRGSSPVISYHTLRRAILTVLLYTHYFEEMFYVFDNLVVSSDIAPTYSWNDLLIHARICLRSIHNGLKEYPYTLGIRTFCDPGYNVSRSSSKNFVCEKLWDRSNFMMAAKETFFDEIDDLSLSRFRLFDPINYGYENEHCEDEYDDDHETDEEDEDDYENNEDVGEHESNKKDYENNEEGVGDHETNKEDYENNVQGVSDHGSNEEDYKNNEEDVGDHESNKEDEHEMTLLQTQQRL